MIVPMKKIHLVVQSKDAGLALDQLRELGSLHVEPLRTIADSQLDVLRGKVEGLSRVIEAVTKTSAAKAQQEACADVDAKTNEITALLQEIERLENSIAQRGVRIKKWTLWGNFKPGDVRFLGERGVFIHLYEIPVKQKVEIPEGAYMETVNTFGGIRRCVVVMRENIQLPYDRVYLPEISMQEKMDLQNKEQRQCEELREKLRNSQRYLGSFERALAAAREELRLKEVAVGAMVEGEFTVLKGFCPQDRLDQLQQTARKEHWGVLIEDVTEDDPAPTLLRNPKWVEIIKPLFGVINVLPGYREADVSLVMLLFFTLFVGMLIGDVGYGAVILLGAASAHVAMRKKIADQTFFILIYLLCCSTIGWGVLTGVYFGQSWLAGRIAPVLPWLNESTNIQMFCFLLGAVHLGIAHLWRTVKAAPSLEMFKEFGWFLLVIVMFFMANNLVLDQPLPKFVMPVFIGGVALIVLFPKPNMAPTFPLDVVSCFTDVVSYIRLYAVGLATVAVADAANEMSIGWVIFLHTLNITLSAMAIMVHGLRLNVLEFSGHLGMTWAGVKYEPFCRQKQTNTE